MKSHISSVLIFMFASFALAQVHDFSHLPKGERKALHGMVVVGSGPYFIEHIPMLMPPHDFQILAEVKLTLPSGKELTQDFSQSAFTLKPQSNFSLNDYVANRLTSFSATIHRGSFELGGPVIPGLEQVQVSVVQMHLLRQVPSSENFAEFKFRDAKSQYSTNVITNEKNVQKIVNQSTGQTLWCVIGPDFFESCL